MPFFGNAWHLPGSSEAPAGAGMREPLFPTDPATGVTIYSGNQFQGDGNTGNQLEVGSSVVWRTANTQWIGLPMTFSNARGNNKYFSATIPVSGIVKSTEIQYYLVIAYSDHDFTFLQADETGWFSVAANEDAARASPFRFKIDSLEQRGQWGRSFTLPNVAVHASLLHTGSVLMWGRRDTAQQSLDTDPPAPLAMGSPVAPKATCTPFLWNPNDPGNFSFTPQPTLADSRTNANLFCSSHAFLPDGRLLVAGGHRFDGAGLNQSNIYDPVANTVCQSWNTFKLLRLDTNSVSGHSQVR
jgi:hypothetical protein